MPENHPVPENDPTPVHDDAPAPVGPSPGWVGELLNRCGFPPPGTEVVCGVSGGADSLALLYLAVQAGCSVTAVHVDHGLRPESGAEAAVVAAAAADLGARFESRSVVVAPGGDLEARARAARLGALGPGALLGHTADDQAETVLINLARGAGPDGISAMRMEHGHPLLGLRRAETHRLCAELGLAVLSDPSNDDPRFVRNRIRHELLPLLADIAGRDPVPLLGRTAAHCAELVDGVNALIGDLDPRDTRALRAAPPIVANAALRAWLRETSGYPPSSAELGRVWAVVHRHRRACEVSGGRRVSRRNGVLTLSLSEVDPPPST